QGSMLEWVGCGLLLCEALCPIPLGQEGSLGCWVWLLPLEVAWFAGWRFLWQRFIGEIVAFGCLD
ncbi:MAG: hypothetical protein ACLFU4_05955, partial [Opitutales bacterium]